MKFTSKLVYVRRSVGSIIFFVIVYFYASLTVKALIRSEMINPVTISKGEQIMEKILAFPAFYFGTDPLTGLIINSVFWGVILTKLLLLLWPIGKNYTDQD